MSEKDTHADTIEEIRDALRELDQLRSFPNESLGSPKAQRALVTLDALVEERDRGWPAQLYKQYLSVLDERDQAISATERERARADRAEATFRAAAATMRQAAGWCRANRRPMTRAQIADALERDAGIVDAALSASPGGRETT